MLLCLEGGEQLLGRVGIVKGERRGAVGAENICQHAQVVAHTIAALNLVVDQQRCTRQEHSGNSHNHAGPLEFFGNRKIPVIGRHSHGCFFTTSARLSNFELMRSRERSAASKST